MIDLHETLQELAEAAVREGATPGPAHAIRRGRQRRRRVTAGIGSLVVVALVAGVAGTGRLTGPPPPAAVAPAGPSTTLPPVVVETGPVTGEVASRLWRDTERALQACPWPSGRPRLIAHATAYGYTWVLGATTPGSGKGMCWVIGRARPGGGSTVATSGSPTSPSKEVAASETQGETFGSVHGYVTERAATVRVLFADGRPALQVPVVKVGAAFPVNFYLAFYPQPGRQRARAKEWAVDQVVALDPAGRVVARCRTRPLPRGTCFEP